MISIRRIAHLDMDAFFASVELLRYPELRGQAVVVGGRNVHQPVEQPDGTKRFARLKDYAGRGVITTSTYEARALGVFSGMGLMKSAQLAPDECLKRIPLMQKIRLLGVRASGLVPVVDAQLISPGTQAELPF
jgi:DNA polymerase-4